MKHVNYILIQEIQVDIILIIHFKAMFPCMYVKRTIFLIVCDQWFFGKSYFINNLCFLACRCQNGPTNSFRCEGYKLQCECSSNLKSILVNCFFLFITSVIIFQFTSFFLLICIYCENGEFKTFYRLKIGPIVLEIFNFKI